MPKLGERVLLYGTDGSSLIALEPETTGELKVSLYGKKSSAADSALIQKVMSSTAYTGDALVTGIVGYHTGVAEVRQLGLDQPNTDSKSFTTGSLPAISYPVLYNASTWDRQRANYEETVLASAARTASVNSSDLTNYNAKGVVVVIDVTSITNTPSITVTIVGKSSLGSDYYTILASAAIATVSVTVLKVSPGMLAIANSVAMDLLPRVWRVQVVNGDSDSITYSISANYVV